MGHRQEQLEQLWKQQRQRKRLARKWQVPGIHKIRQRKDVPTMFARQQFPFYRDRPPFGEELHHHAGVLSKYLSSAAWQTRGVHTTTTLPSRQCMLMARTTQLRDVRERTVRLWNQGGNTNRSTKEPRHCGTNLQVGTSAYPRGYMRCKHQWQRDDLFFRV